MFYSKFPNEQVIQLKTITSHLHTHQMIDFHTAGIQDVRFISSTEQGSLLDPTHYITEILKPEVFPPKNYFSIIHHNTNVLNVSV